MTCIVGIVNKVSGVVWIGGDSISVSDWDKFRTKRKKVFSIGDLLIGSAGSVRMQQILQHHVKPKPRKKNVSVEKYMVTVFAEEVRTAFKKFGFTTINNNNEVGGTFLVGYAGRLFTFYSDFQINEFSGDVAAIGIGANFALGAMMALEDLPPKKRIKYALEIAEKLSIGVAGPFVIRSK